MSGTHIACLWHRGCYSMECSHWGILSSSCRWQSLLQKWMTSSFTTPTAGHPQAGHGRPCHGLGGQKLQQLTLPPQNSALVRTVIEKNCWDSGKNNFPQRLLNYAEISSFRTCHWATWSQPVPGVDIWDPGLVLAAALPQLLDTSRCHRCTGDGYHRALQRISKMRS